MADDERTAEAPDGARENEHEPPPLPDHPAIPDDDLLAAAVQRFPDAIAHVSAGQPVVYVEPQQWGELGRWLREEQEFETCVDVCGVDHLLNRARPVPDGVTPQRFEVVANFVSRSRNRRVRAICQVPAADPAVPSLAPVYPGTDWAERETYDLFGIRFDGHPDLTRLLLPDDWEGWPLRKDDAAARVPVQFKGTRVAPFQQALGRQPTGGAGSQP